MLQWKNIDKGFLILKEAMMPLDINLDCARISKRSWPAIRNRMYTIFIYNLLQPVLIYMSACCIISVRCLCTYPMYFPIVFVCGFIFIPSWAFNHLNFQPESLLLLYNWGKAQFIFRSDISHKGASKLNTHFSWISQDEKSSLGSYKMKCFDILFANF